MRAAQARKQMAADDASYNEGQSFYAQLCNSKRQVRPDPGLMSNLMQNVVGTVVDNYSRLELGNLGVLIERAPDVAGVSLRYLGKDEAGLEDAAALQPPTREDSAKLRRAGMPAEITDSKVRFSCCHLAGSGRVGSGLYLTGGVSSG